MPMTIQKKQVLLFSGSLLIHAIVCILAGALNWFNQFMIVPIAGAITISIVYSQWTKRWYWLVLAIIPFYLVYVAPDIIFGAPQTYPIWIIGLLCCTLTILLLRIQYRSVSVVGIVAVIAILGRFFFMPSYFAFLDTEKNPEKYRLENVSIKDSVNKNVSFNEQRGKIILVDIWNSACGICIEKFPELQKLYDKYKADSNIRVFALDIPVDRPGDRELVQKQAAPYSFPKLFFTDRNEADKLYINGVPLVLIFDRNMKCRYAGGLNTGMNIFIGNAETIIENLKQEP